MIELSGLSGDLLGAGNFETVSNRVMYTRCRLLRFRVA
jgi:hypothetical protein